MKPSKPLFMKTYGKQRRKVSAWISPENRKQAFDSTPSTDSDISVFEPPKPTKIRERKTSVSSHRVLRPAKKKVTLCLTESFDEDDVSSSSSLKPARQSKTARSVKETKRRAKRHLTETSSDEENMRRPAQHSKATRKSGFVPVPGILVRQKRQRIPWISESEEDSAAKCPESSFHTNDHLPSVGRFVTRRRRAVSAKPKLPKAKLSVLNSSDDFTSGAFGSIRILRPSRRRRVPLAFLVSSAENSVNVPGTVGFATNSLREISLNELADNSLGPYPRKPIFCSTPSAGPISKRPRFIPLPTSDQSATSPPLSASCIGVLSTFQEDLASPEQFVSPPRSAPLNELHSEEQSQSSFGEQEPSGDLFMKDKSTYNRRRYSGEAKSHTENQDIKTKNGGKSQSLTLSTDDIESSQNSHFLSAAGELEWLIEALKEKCLTVHCTVQLERLYNLSVTQLCSQTAYTSCLGPSGSGQSPQTTESPLCVDSIQTVDLSESSKPSFNLHLSMTNNKTSGFLQSVISVEAYESSLPVDCKHSSSKKPPEHSASEMHIEPTHHAESDELITQLPSHGPMRALFTEKDEANMKKKYLTKKCAVHLQKWALSQLNAPQLTELMKQKETGMAFNTTSTNPGENRCEIECTDDADNTDDLTHSGEITEKMMASNRRPLNNSSPVVETQPTDAETEEKVPPTSLKEKCLSNKLTVGIKRLTLSQLKESLQLKDKKLSGLHSCCDNQIKTHHQSESDTNHSNEITSATRVSLIKRGVTSSKELMSSDKEAAQNSRNVSHKRKKTSLAPKEKKRRSTSTDRHGTTRKACVSGLSVRRWKNNDGTSTHMFRSRTAQVGANKTVDCSISELISAQQKQPRELLGSTMNFSTPVRASRLNLSSLLADLTPNTNTWSRLKAALSVHRKGMVLCTPRSLRVMGTPRRAELVDVSQDLFATPFKTSLSKHLRSQLLTCDSPVVCEDGDLSDAQKVYAECGQQHPLPWEECILPQRMKQCVKIGEGTFGEVFSTTNASGDTVALKIIPVEGSEQVNGEDQKTFGEILHEIIISKELSSLKEKQQNQTHGFIGLNDLHCVQGCYPPDVLNAWDAFDQQKGSENDRPDFFEKDQLFLILEFEFGGVDLENSNGTLTSLGVAKSILHQVTAALAVAEQELHFEHRDLHWGNVLVKPTKQRKGSFLLNGAVHSLETKGVWVRIIDYSLSRLEIDDLTVSCDISKDEELFLGQGDYQFDIYRLMRQENGNNWSNYHPHTNVLWLHYLCSKLLSMKYRGSGGRGAKEMREALTRFSDHVLQYGSATELLQNYPMFQ